MNAAHGMGLMSGIHFLAAAWLATTLWLDLLGRVVKRLPGSRRTGPAI
ncbi:hypothetical protein [Pseudooceanicola sp.]|nr:hypothetical protein [Pseudooceanicola sp.]